MHTTQAPRLNIVCRSAVRENASLMAYVYQQVKERASRVQSESLLSSFAEAKPFFATKSQRTPEPNAESCLQGSSSTQGTTTCLASRFSL